MTLKVHLIHIGFHFTLIRAAQWREKPSQLDILGVVELESSFGKLSPEWSGLILPLYLLQGLRQRRLCSQAMFSAFQELA